jgi:hypothetical protein
MAVVRGSRSMCVQGFAGAPRALGLSAAAALSFVFFALAGDEAPAQSGG